MRGFAVIFLVLIASGAVQADLAKFAEALKTPQGERNLMQFTAFQKEHSKSYDDAHQFAARFLVFSENLEKIEAMNKMDPDASYAMNEFGDLSEEEFARTMLGHKPIFEFSNLPKASAPVRDAPASFDWREKGGVTEVKNQGQCGSCWAYSTTGAIEGAIYKKTNKLVSLSEQNLVDCDHECVTDEGQQICDSGCKGGLPISAYSYVMKNGLMSESDYPYKGADGTCRFDKSKVAATISSFKQLSKDEKEIAAQLAENGPVSIGINASWMQFYFGGISNPILCSPNKLDHGVLIVGFGTDASKGKDYWIIKNSWGPKWGEQGYYRIVRGTGKCGVNQMATIAIA
eukprot:GILJ01000312.1.p1 GENE.GILJ01000312.1~~GILJ01000312.1.p1  ORF type:complete len:358 (-),score=74.73 GILJ01000312.1:176-1207(-)